MNSPGSMETASPKREGGNIVFLLLASYLFLIFLRPFDLIPSLKAFHLPLVTGGLCVVAYVVSRLSTGRGIFPLTPMTKALAYMTIWILITVPFAFYITGSARALWNDWVKVIILFLLLANVMQSVKQVRRAVWVCVLGATGVSVIAVALDMLLGESVTEGRLVSDASGLYSGPNFFSMTLILLMPYALMFFFLHRRVLVRLFFGFVVVTFTVANMMTESRAGVLGEALVVLLVFWKLRAWGISLVKTLGVVALGMVLCLPLAPKGLWQRFSTLFSDSEVNTLDPNSAAASALGSKRQREDLLIRAIILTAENPIFGVGMNNFPAAAHNRFNSGPEDWLGCHDTFLQISAELGIPGLMLYLFLLYTTFKTLRQLKERLAVDKTTGPDLRDMRMLSDATMISFLGYVMFSAVAHLGNQPYFFIVAGFAQGLSNISLQAEAPASSVPGLTLVTAA